MGAKILGALLLAACAKGTSSPSSSEPAPRSSASVAGAVVLDVGGIPDECASHPELGGCVWQAEDRAGEPDRVHGTDPARARAAMEAQRAKVSRCVASARAGDRLGEELRRRVRVRARFVRGRVEGALFQTEAQGYGLIDKFSHICIVEALADVRIAASDGGATPVTVTHTYTFAGDAGPGAP